MSNPFLSSQSSPGSNPFLSSADQEQDKQFYDDTFVGELGEGVVSGVVGIGEGLIGLGAMGVDLLAGTNYGDKVTAGAEALRDAAGLDPEGFVGKGAEIVTQFVVPGLGAAGAVAKASKAARAAKGLTGPMSKSERFALAAKELAAAGAVDAAVSTDGMTTISDWVDAGPLQTDELIGLSGREKALARMTNRLKIGAESALLGGVAQTALVGAGKTVGQIKMPTVAAEKIDKVGKQIDDLLYTRMTAAPGSPEELGKFKSGLADAIAFTRYRGYLPKQAAEKRLLIDGQVQTQIKKADRILRDLEGEIDTALKNMPTTGGNLDRAGIMTRIEDYLTEADPAVKTQLLGQMPREVRASAKRMRSHIDTLSKDVLDTKFLEQNNFVTKSGQNIKDLIDQNLNSYLRRRYRIFEDSKYVPTEESKKVAQDFFRANRKGAEKELTEYYRRALPGEIPQDFAAKNGLTITGAGNDLKVTVGAKVTDEAARVAQENFLRKYSIRSRERLGGGRMAKDRLETGMFLTRENVPRALRQLLGEIDDPREAYLGTVADLAQFTAVDDYFATITRMAEENSGIGKLFVDGNQLTPDQARGLRDSGYVKLGGTDGASSGVQAVGREADEVEQAIGRAGWGTLDGYYVPTPIYKELTRQVLAEDSIGTTVLRGTLGTFLKAKGLSQYSKTVLSPITQVRNFTTALAFATAKGNVPVVGRGGSLRDSAQAVFANITNRGDDALFEELADAQRRGVLGTNAELREIQDSLNKGLNVTARTPQSGLEALGGEKLARSVGKFTKPFEQAYQGSDDFWKFFSYNAEQAKLRHALRDATPDQQLAYLTKGGQDVSVEMAERLRKAGGEPPVRDGYVRLYHAGDLDPNAPLKNSFTSNKQYAQSIGGKDKLYYVDVDKADNLVSAGAINNFKTTTTVTLGRDDFNRLGAPKMVGEIDTKVIDDLIKDRAAQIVRDTVPNYNKAASGAVSLGRKLPVGNFISFPAEMMRTGFNIVRQGLDDMASDIPAVQARGRQRLMGFAMTTAVAPAAALEAAYALSGVDREEMDAYKRSFAPEWEKGSVLLPVGRTEDGRIEYVNFSTSNPYDVLSRFANRAINEADDAVKEGKDPSQVITDVAGAALYEFFQPFLSEAMLTEALIDVTARGGRTATGAEVYNPADSVGTKASKMFMHVADTLLPNVVPITVSSGKVEPSRFLRGVLGSEEGSISNMDKMGRVRDPIGELARQMTGVSVQDFDPKLGLEFGAYRLGQLQTNAKRIFNRVTDDRNATSDQLFNAFVQANEAKLRIDREYYQMFKDLRAMGMTDREIGTILKKNGVGGWKGVINGEFVPFELTRKNFQEAFDAGVKDRLPNDRIRQYYRENVGRSLEEPLVEPEPRPSVPAPAPVNPFLEQAPAPVNPFLRQGALTSPALPRVAGPVNPALLGDNPMDQAANAQIAARLGQG